MAYQLSQLRTNLLYLKKDLSDVSNDVFVSWVRDVAAYIYRRLPEQDPTPYISTANYPSVTTGAYPLPADFGDIKPQGTGFYLIDTNGYQTSHRLQPSTFGSNMMGYYLTQSDVYFNNLQNATQYTLRYIPRIVLPTSPSDYFTVDTLANGTPIVPDEYIDFIVKALDVKYTQWDEVPGDESLADVRYERIMSDLFNELSRTPKSFGVPMTNIMY